ncbi:hypothetical protein GCM10011399_23080 [Subtercola lobariae]|uniref:Uncharacterized protein n=1 Tax=Subtercola lobariae TaxID=1588641 RepID=A0A917B9A3_9MICO|nr:hypothetical protein GCM10011399_23080 [Subtercola lobariae]
MFLGGRRFERLLERGLAFEGAMTNHGTAVNPLNRLLLVEKIEVGSNRDVRDAEGFAEIGHARKTELVDHLQHALAPNDGRMRYF